MIFEQRDYQDESVAEALGFLTDNTKKQRGKNGLLVLPTGAGKSLVIARVAKALGAPLMVFQPSKELVEQNFDKLVSYGERPGIYSASLGRKEIREITLATIGSVKSKADLFADSRFALIDECDGVNAKEGMYFNFLAQLAHLKVLGLTATPYRMARDQCGTQLKFLTRTRPKAFHRVVHVVQNGDLFARGYLAPLKYFEVKGFNRKAVKQNTTGADYDDDSCEQHLKAIKFQDKIVRVVERLLEIERKNVVVFTRFTAESYYVADRIRGAEVVTAKTPPLERKRIIDGFKSGQVKVVCNVGILDTGFDFPALETVVLARPTLSLRLYYQMIGRGVRCHPGKDHCMIVDMVNLTEMFGHVEDLVVHPNGRTPFIAGSDGRQFTNVYIGENAQRAQREAKTYWKRRHAQRRMEGGY